MNQSIQIYNDIVTKVKFFFKQLRAYPNNPIPVILEE